MTHHRISLSDRNIAVLPFVAARQEIVRDADLAGFFLVVGARSKTFMIQGDLRVAGKRQTVRIKVGEVGKVTAREARAKAKALLGSIADGIDPRPKANLERGLYRTRAIRHCARRGSGIAKAI